MGNAAEEGRASMVGGNDDLEVGCGPQKLCLQSLELVRNTRSLREQHVVLPQPCCVICVHQMASCSNGNVHLQLLQVKVEPSTCTDLA